MSVSGRLKLRAQDREDVQVIASVLQDALVPLKDIAFQRRDQRFVMVANRFRWEANRAAEGAAEPAAKGSPGQVSGDASFEDDAEPLAFERVNCGVSFDKVANVRFRGLDLKQRDQFLNLLTVSAEPEAITLLFSDGAAIRLEVTGIACRLEDIGEPWPTRWRPEHRLDAEEQSG